jgi:extracellular elastinolytic metalloproteinase
MAVSSEVASRQNGVTHVYFQQRYRGIDVHNGILNVNIGRDGRVVSADSRFFADIAAAAGEQSARSDAVDAAAVAAGRLELKRTAPFRVLSREGDAAGATTLSSGGISESAIGANLVWMPVGKTVRLAWKMEIEETGGEHWWNVFVDAETREVLAQHDLIVHDFVDDIANAFGRRKNRDHRFSKFPRTDGAKYRVFPLPFEIGSS